jgi:tetratricopeptide (TPR) repeat protein
MPRALLATLLIGCWINGCWIRWTASAEQDDLADARQLLLRGNYREAAERFGKLDLRDADVAIGLARTRLSVGDRQAAEKVLRAACDQQPDRSTSRARLSGELASLAFEGGDHEAARGWCQQALLMGGADREGAEAGEDREANLLARWIGAELLRVGGRLDEAEQAYRWFIDYYNSHEVDDPEALLLIGKAAAMHARWTRASDQFGFLVNELYPAILRREPNFWPAHLEAGRLFLEKFNDKEAAREFQQALAINPQAAEVHAAVAHLALQRFDMPQARAAVERALAINPNLLSARHARADLLAANFQTAEAARCLEEARRLNPRQEQTLGRLAAAYIVLDGYRPEESGKGSVRVEPLMAEVLAANVHAGEFFATLAQQLEERRRFDLAAHYFREALERMPRLVGPQAGLGMLYMRLGKEEEARNLLRQAFEVDPFNVRVANSLQVLEVLAGYQTRQTEHFLIRFDPEKDRLLAEYAARHLEQVYPELCRLLGYEPRGKSLVEIFNRARNTSGHGWFSARTVGLPYIGTVGACAGKMVAIASPNEGKHKFNWARVLKHEMVHVINLQQTNFNIPHWFTEALAVWNEGGPRPQEWNALLLERVPRGDIFSLDDINLAFARPESNENWQLAYCQAELYAEFMLAKYGHDSLAKMLAAYADNLDTPAALKRSLGVDQPAFEAGYKAYLRELVARLASGGSAQEAVSMAELEHQAESHPDDADALARLALAHLEKKNYPDARKWANKALARRPRQAVASYVLARLQLLIGDEESALAALAAAHDASAPEEHLVGLLASLRLKRREFAEAAKLYQTMADRHPDDIRWVKALARVYLLSKQNKPLAKVLARLAELDADDVAVRKKLAALALAEENYQQAAVWARRALEIDVMDVDIHRWLAQALLEQGANQEAIAEYQVAIELAPDDANLRYALADAWLQLPDKNKARECLESLLKLKPDYPGAQELLETLKP